MVTIHGQSISVSAKAAIIRDGKLLLVRYDHPFTHYNLPGGRLLNGESLHEAVHRKLRMECAAEVQVGKLLWVLEHIPDPLHPEPEDYQKVQFTFEAQLLPGSEPAMPEHAEDQDGVEWLDLKQLLQVQLFPLVAPKLLEILEVNSAYDPLLQEERGTTEA